MPDPAVIRYSSGPLPPYRYVPGRSPHPRRDPRGHGYGRPEPRPVAVDPGAWASSAIYLRGVDLFNLAFWWESHEAFEALWRGAGEGTAAQLFQGVIQVAAAELKRSTGSDRGAETLYGRGLERLGRVPSPFLGMDVRRLIEETEAWRRGELDAPARITLALPGVVP